MMSVDSDTPSTIGSSPCCSVLFSSSWASSSFSSRAALISRFPCCSGIVVILSGAFELYLGTKAPTGSGMGWYIAGGVIEILLGILLLCTPSMLFTILPFVLGFWLLFRGFMAVGVASEMMGVGIKGAGWTMTLGILVIISAFLVLFNPIIGVGVVVFWVGLSLLLAGVDLIAHAVTLRRLRKEL